MSCLCAAWPLKAAMLVTALAVTSPPQMNNFRLLAVPLFGPQDNAATSKCRNTAGGAGDLDGFGCAYYSGSDYFCGYYDDSDFSALSMCCGCGGGSPCSDDSAGEALCSLYDELHGQSWCGWGSFDSVEFTAQDMCCGCGGGHTPSPTPAPPHTPAPPPTPAPPKCRDLDAGNTDVSGMRCLYGYRQAGFCGNYDDTDFTASALCCGCGGGATCEDSAGGALDLEGDTCDMYDKPDIALASWRSKCHPDIGALPEGELYQSPFDDEDFSASSLCCACGGGLAEGESSPPTPVVAQTPDWPPGCMRGPFFCNETVVICEGEHVVPGGAFRNCIEMISVYLPDSITEIGSSAFDQCFNLAEVRLPSSLVTIGSSAFAHVPMSRLSLPDSVQMIGPMAFAKCSSLSSVDFGEAPAVISQFAFMEAESLSDIVIGDCVSAVHDMAFTGCENTRSVIIGDSVTFLGEFAFDRGVGIEQVSLGRSLVAVGKDAFNECCNITYVVSRSSQSLTGIFPPCHRISHLTTFSVGANSILGHCRDLESASVYATDISSEAFADCVRLASVALAPSVQSIGYAAFRGSLSLTALEVGEAVTTIGPEAFKGCRSLAAVTISPTVGFIGTDAFSGCSSLASVAIPSWIPGGVSAVFDCSVLATVHFLESVSSIADEILKHCSSVVSVSLPAGVESIGNSAFYGCVNLTHLAVSDSIVFIGASAFEGCVSIEEAPIPPMVVQISEHAFSNCIGLRSVTMGSAVTTIERYAFYQLPLHDDQPVFRSVHTGRNTFHYVGAAQKVELEWAQDRMHMKVTPITFEEDILGASSSQMRLLAAAVVTKSLSRSSVDGNLVELYGRLDALLVHQAVANSRRRWNKAVFSVFLALPAVLGLLKGNAALLEPDITQARVSWSMGVALLLLATLMWRSQGLLFAAMHGLFSAEDGMDDDTLGASFMRRLSGGEQRPPQDSKPGEAESEGSAAPVQAAEEVPESSHAGGASSSLAP